MVMNYAQTQLTKELLSSLTQSVRDELLEFIHNVPFIQNLISDKRKRACDCPRDESGKIVVDLSNPHILENMDYFRPSAIHFKKYGCYTKLKPNSNPNSEYAKWIRTEVDRIWNGMVRPEDGEWIPGTLYFYWNYSPIMQTKVSKKSKKADRVKDFPEVWDSTYIWAHYIEQAVKGGKYNNYEGGQHWGVIAKRGIGKAHPYSEYVYTPEGKITWEQVKVGTNLFGDDGKITKVIDIPFDDYVDTYRITLRDGRSILCSDEHLWKVEIHNRKNIEILSTKELLKIYKRTRKQTYRNPNGIEYVCSIPKNSGCDFIERDVKIDPYTLGLLLGDGCFRNCNIYLTMLNEDYNEIKPFIKYNSHKTNSSDVTHKIEIPNAKKILKEYGLYLKKSEDKFIPDDYKINSREVRLNVLHGLVDTDGYVLNKHNAYYISTSSKQLADDIMTISRSLGFNSSVSVKDTKYFNKKKNEYINCLKSYTVTIYSDIKLGRLKRKTAADCTTNYSKSRFNKTRIIDIEYVGKMKSKCVTVDNESHCYLINDFVTTHNSYMMSSLLARLFICGDSSVVKSNVKATVIASDKKFLINDGTLTKFVDTIDHCAITTEFPARRIKSSMGDMQWIMGYKDTDNEQIIRGTKNEVSGISVKDDPDKVRGRRGMLTLYEEFGAFPNFIETLNTSKYNVEEGNYSFGTIGCCGTGGTKGCLTENNFIFTGTGDIKLIKDITKEDGIIGYDISNQTHSIENISFLSNPVKKKCLRITTNSFRTIECSIDHPIFSSTKTDCNGVRLWDWCKADELQVNDKIAICQEIPVFSDKPIFDARLIGLLIGDGTYIDSPKIISCDEEVLNYIKNKYDYSVYEHNITEGGKVCEVLGIKKIRDELRNLGIYKQSKINKRLPDAIFKASKSDVADLIAGLIDTDGCINNRFNKNRNSWSSSIKIASSSLELMKQVQLLLMKLGVYANIEKHNPSKKVKRIMDRNPYYEIEILTRDSIIKLHDSVKLLIKYKQDAFDKAYEIQLNKKRWRKQRFEYETIKKIEVLGEQTVYNLTANNTHTYLGNGIITHNSDFSGALTLIYAPEGYRFYPLPNVYDKNAQGKSSSLLFLGAYLSRKGCYDSNGNSDIIKALIELINEREKVKLKSPDPSTLTQLKAELPITIQECIMQVNVNVYPVADLNERLNQLALNPHERDGIKVGKFNMNGGTVTFELTDDQPITNFPHKDNRLVGAVEIIKEPEINKQTNNVFSDRYIAGLDTYDNDVAESLSLGSIFVLDMFTDQIVCEYTGRPTYADEFYEIARRMCLYYNCKLNYESNKKGLYAYFSRMNSTYILTDRFDYLSDKDLYKGVSYGNVTKGTTATVAVKAYSRKLIRDWLIKPCVKYEQKGDEQIETTYMNLFNIKNIALLKELSMYNFDGNFDRHDALAMLMIYREDILRVCGGDVNKEENTDNILEDKFFKRYDDRMSRFKTQS